jgi:hypothetical protein
MSSVDSATVFFFALVILLLGLVMVGLSLFSIKRRPPTSNEHLAEEIVRLSDKIRRLQQVIDSLTSRLSEDAQIIAGLRSSTRALELQLAAATGNFGTGKPASSLTIMRLRKVLVDNLSTEELTTLASDVGINLSDLGAVGKEAQARELLSLLNRQTRVGELIWVLRRTRPEIELRLEA